MKKLKVLHVINSLGTGGAERLLVDALPRYSSLGIETDLLCLKSGGTIFYEDLQKRFKGKITILGTGSEYNPLHIFRLKPHLLPYDIVHVHLFPSLYWVALTRFLFGVDVKLVFTEHNTTNRRLDSFLFRLVDRVIYKAYTKITTITPEVRDRIVSALHIKPENCPVIYNGVDISRFENARAYRSADFFQDDAAVIIIQVSRFQVQKDQNSLIRAMQHLPGHFKLLLVGDGPLKDDLIHLANGLGLAERILFLGVRDDIPELLKMSDVVVQSSNWEGFGLAAVEGMAAGKPVVASNVPGLKEVVDGAGITFTKGDEKDLARKILSLFDGSSLYALTAAKCISRAREFSIEVMVKRFSELYESIK